MLNAEIQTPLGLTGATADAVYTSPLYWDDCLMNDPKTKGTATSQHLNAKGSAIRSDKLRTDVQPAAFVGAVPRWIDSGTAGF